MFDVVEELVDCSGEATIADTCFFMALRTRASSVCTESARAFEGATVLTTVQVEDGGGGEGEIPADAINQCKL
jgi:hypothetical protein